MNHSINNRKNVARMEKKQRKTDAGYVHALFPDVSSIIISMEYRQKGIKQTMPRTVNFFPSCYAYFRIDCLNSECLDGGFDFSRIISTMVADHKKMSKGEFACQGNLSPDHSAVDYEVAIQYA
jgi:hypothetical protein